MIEVVLLRHGQSTWNVDNRFTGWTDVDLSPHGEREAHEAGRALKNHGFHFERAFTSVLKRAIRTLWIVLQEMDLCWLPVVKDWRLNERHYGALQGLNKAQVERQYGSPQVRQWRRGYRVRPPALDLGDPRHPRFDPLYKTMGSNVLPAAESLEDTLRRVTACWEDTIVPCLDRGETTLIVAHGNSLRALIKRLDGISDEDVMDLNIPTGIPLVYEFDNLLHVTNRYYLADPEQVAAALRNVVHRSIVAVEG